MTSDDNVILIRSDLLDAKLETIKVSIQLDNERISSQQSAKTEERLGQLSTQIQVLSTRIDGLNARLTDMQSAISWSFTLATVFVAIIGVLMGIIVAFAPTIWAHLKHVRSPELPRDEVKTIVSEEVKAALDEYFGNLPKVKG